MRIFYAVVAAGTFGAVMFGASLEAMAADTPPATLKCKAPKVPTQVTAQGKTTWKCVVPPPAPPPPPPPPPPASAAPAESAAPPREPPNSN